MPSGSLIFLIHGCVVPAGYTFVGSTTVDVKLAGQFYSTDVKFDIYRKN
jgi:hypothetical protein